MDLAPLRSRLADAAPWLRLLPYGLMLLLGFTLGWAARAPKPVPPLVVGHTKSQPERDLSPQGETRTVIVTKVVPGPPAPPPVPVPPDLGQQIATTTTALPSLPEGGAFHAATFAQLQGTHLQLRTVEWLTHPDGTRVELGEAQTTETTLSLPLPPAPALPKWAASVLVAPQGGRAAYGGLVQRSWGPWSVSLGHIGGVSFAGVGVRW